MINKYLKTIVAIVVMTASIGTYYVSGYIKDHSYPDFKFQTIEGDESLIKPLVLSGTYVIDDSNSEYFQLASDDFIYRHQQTLYDDLKGVPFSYERTLKEKYKSLLRSSRFSFITVENDEHVGIARFETEHEWRNNTWSWDSTMFVNVVDKKTRKITKMSYDLGGSAFNGMRNPPSLEEIQINENGEAIVFVLHRNYGAEHDQFIVEAYVFDLEDAKFKQKHTILSVTDSGMHRLHETPYWKANRYVLYRVYSGEEPTSEVDDVDEYVDEFADEYADEYADGAEDVKTERAPEKETPVRVSTLYAYDVNKHERFEVVLPEDYQYSEVHMFDGENLYFSDHSDGANLITVYNIERAEVVSQFEIDAHMNTYLSTYDGMVYAVEMTHGEIETPRVHVYDAMNGKRLYLGEIVPVKGDQSEEGSKVHFYSIVFRP